MSQVSQDDTNKGRQTESPDPITSAQSIGERHLTGNTSPHAENGHTREGAPSPPSPSLWTPSPKSHAAGPRGRRTSFARNLPGHGLTTYDRVSISPRMERDSRPRLGYTTSHHLLQSINARAEAQDIMEVQYKYGNPQWRRVMNHMRNLNDERNS